MRIFPVLSFAAVMMASTAAQATWSIVAVDPETEEVGVALASCVPEPFDETVLPRVPALVPGVGALAAQGLFDPAQRDLAASMLLANERTAAEILMALQEEDPSAGLRQYGIVILGQEAATVTGEGLPAWSGGAVFDTLSVQGNVLVSEQVVTDAVAAFSSEGRCPAPLAERLLRALEAGAAAGGDMRCAPEQSASSAVLVVAAPGDALDEASIRIEIPFQPEGGANPVALLREAFEKAYGSDDCDGGTGSGGAVDTTGGPDASGGTTSSGTGGGTGSVGSTTSGDSIGAPAEETTGAGAETESGTDPSRASSEARRGGCTVTGTAGGLPIALGLLLSFGWRRRVH